MAFSVNPLQFKTDKLDTDPQRKSFLGRLGDLLNQITSSLLSPSFLASVLNSNAQLFNTSLVFKSVELGTVSTNQSVECANASGVAVHMQITTAVNLTLTLSHLALGVPVMIWFGNASAGAQTFKVAATQPGGTAYTDVVWKSSTAFTDMTATGLSINAGVTMIACGAAVPIAPNWELGMVTN